VSDPKSERAMAREVTWTRPDIRRKKKTVSREVLLPIGNLSRNFTHLRERS